MKKLPSTLSNMVLVLVGVAVVTGCLLAFVNNRTSALIASAKENLLSQGIKTVMGSGEITIAKREDITLSDATGKERVFVLYHVSDAQGLDLGAAVESAVSGFGGNLRLLVGFSPQGDILGYTILEHAETPGLGAKATTWFQKDGKGNIIGKNPASSNLTTSKDGGEVDAITASTITSRAFLLAVTNAYAAYQNEVDRLSGATAPAP